MIAAPARPRRSAFLRDESPVFLMGLGAGLLCFAWLSKHVHEATATLTSKPMPVFGDGLNLMYTMMAFEACVRVVGYALIWFGVARLIADAARARTRRGVGGSPRPNSWPA